ncbi:MAG TPA: MFS transporter [Solirubrobacteraceae bacterium]|nr:MFS transporter [Solirubrobacteraceae bacterium]
MRDGRVRRIVAAYTVNRLGTWFGFIALAIAVYDHTHSAASVAGLLLCAQVLPAFLVPALVARVETSTRRGALSRLYLFEALATAALAGLVMWHFTLPGMLLLAALDGTAALAASALLRAAAARAARSFALRSIGYGWDAGSENPALARQGPGEQSPDGQGPGEEGPDGQGPGEEAAQVAERRANAAINIGFAITFTVGPALAGATVSAFGVPAALWIDVASFLICGAMLIDLTPHVEDSETTTVRARLSAARNHIAASQVLARLLVVQAVALVFFEFSPPIEVAYAKGTLHAGDGGYGILLGVWGLGAAIGSVVFARSIKRSLGVLLTASTLALGVAYLGWAVAPSLTVACAAGLIGGIGNGVQWAALISAVQRLTPERLHAQLMGAVESIGAISPGFGFALGGVIAATASPRVAWLVAGVGACACTIAFMRLPLGGVAAGEKTPDVGSELGANVHVEPEWAQDLPARHETEPSKATSAP